jgi:hypothetical protein
MNTISNIATQAYKIANKISKSKFDEEEIIRIQAQQHALTSSVKVSNKRKRPPLSSERNVRVGFADQEEISSSGSTVVVVV